MDLGDFKSLSRAMPSEVGSIPTHSRQRTRRGVSARSSLPRSERKPLYRIASIVAGSIIVAMSRLFAGSGAVALRPTRPPPRPRPGHREHDTPDYVACRHVEDSLGVPGTARRGQTGSIPRRPKRCSRDGIERSRGSHPVGAKEEPEGGDALPYAASRARQVYNGRRLEGGAHDGLRFDYLRVAVAQLRVMEGGRSAARHPSRAIRRTLQENLLPSSTRKKRAPFCGGRARCG